MSLDGREIRSSKPRFAAALLPAQPCGLARLAGARRERPTLAARRHAEPGRLLDAEARDGAADHELSRRRRRARASRSRQSYGPSTARRRPSPPGSRPTSCSSSWPGDVQILVDAGLVDAELGRAVLQGHRGEHGRRVRAPRRQPEEDQGLERPDQARRPGDHAGPVQLGLGEVEHPRRLRRPAPPRQDRRAGDRLRPERCSRTWSRSPPPARTRRPRSSPARATC